MSVSPIEALMAAGLAIVCLVCVMQTILEFMAFGFKRPSRYLVTIGAAILTGAAVIRLFEPQIWAMSSGLSLYIIMLGFAEIVIGLLVKAEACSPAGAAIEHDHGDGSA